MALKGKNPVTSNVALDDQVLEQTSHFNYLGCDISYDYDKNINVTK
jgi:hypothetical protein